MKTETEGLSREELRDKQYREWVNGPNFSQSSSKIWDGGYEAGWQAASLKQAEPQESENIALLRACNDSLHSLCAQVWKALEPSGEYEGELNLVEFAATIRAERDALEGKQAEPPSQPAIRLKELRDKFHANHFLDKADSDESDAIIVKLAESPSQASTNTIEILYHTARKAELEALRQRDAALLKLEHFKEAKKEWARRIAVEVEKLSEQGKRPSSQRILALMGDTP